MPTDLAAALLVTVRWRRDEGFELDTSVQFDPGVTVLFGPSGSGKSTLLSLVAGLVAPKGTSVKLGDQVWTDPERGLLVKPEQRRVAYVFQSLALFPHMTARQNVSFGIERSLTPAARDAKAMRSLERFRATHLADRRPRTYSGGEAQRVALARAFAMDPRALLLDEPFSALDADLKDGFIHELRLAAKDLGVVVVHVTHDRAEARKLADRVMLMQAGRVVRQGTAEELFRAVDSDRDANVLSRS